MSMNKTVESYGKLAIEKNEIMPFAVIWMELEVIMLSEVIRERKTYDITYMWNLKNDISEVRLLQVKLI